MTGFHGAYAASVTPLADGGERIDAEAIPAVVDFLVAGGLDGLLAFGTMGEGILLDRDERKRAAEAFVAAADGRIAVVVHCGAQTTADAAALAAHAAEAGADAVAVIGPPYFAFDGRSLLDHFAAAASACEPLPFFLYEFADRTGYPVPLDVIERLRERAPNFVGMKVSDSPWERFEPYLLDGLAVFVGPEALIAKGMAAGAVGAVSALAAAFPEPVAELVARPSAAAAERVGTLRASLQRLPFHAAQKLVLQRRGVPVREDVRRPLRLLDAAERRELERIVDEQLGMDGEGRSDRDACNGAMASDSVGGSA